MGSAGVPATAASGARQRFGRCEVELESHRMFDLAADGAEVPMTAMEYELIRVFLANPNRVLSRDQLLMHTRNREWKPFDSSIDIRIGRLRRRVEPDPAAGTNSSGATIKCVVLSRQGGVSLGTTYPAALHSTR